MEIADHWGGDLVLLEADLTSEEAKKSGGDGPGVDSVLCSTPSSVVQMDLVVSRFNLHYPDFIRHVQSDVSTAEFGIHTLLGLFLVGGLSGYRPPTLLGLCG